MRFFDLGPGCSKKGGREGGETQRDREKERTKKSEAGRHRRRAAAGWLFGGPF